MPSLQSVLTTKPLCPLLLDHQGVHTLDKPNAEESEHLDKPKNPFVWIRIRLFESESTFFSTQEAKSVIRIRIRIRIWIRFTVFPHLLLYKNANPNPKTDSFFVDENLQYRNSMAVWKCFTASSNRSSLCKQRPKPECLKKSKTTYILLVQSCNISYCLTITRSYACQ